MSVYQSDPNPRPDSEFEPGTLAHLVPGNRGRMLDPRRTGVSLTALHPERGAMDLRIEAFEDKGAVWEIPFEEIGHYQFAKGSATADESVQAEARAAVERLDRPLEVPRNDDARADTLACLAAYREDADRWLGGHARFFREGGELPDPDTRCGDSRLAADLTAYLGSHGLTGLESVFATRFVSNPYAGEMVKGHRLVMAELGLTPFRGKVVRDPDLFEGAWARERRREHILRRMAFVHAVFLRLELPRVNLFRGFSTTDPVRPPANRTFVSASFSLAVAKSHFTSAADGTGVLYRHAVPVERLFMTYHETAQMNEQFLEAEAVVLYEENALPF